MLCPLCPLISFLDQDTAHAGPYGMVKRVCPKEALDRRSGIARLGITCDATVMQNQRKDVPQDLQ